MPEYVERAKVLAKGTQISGFFCDMIPALEVVHLPAADVAPVRHGSIIETIEDGRMKRVFSCCGTDFTEMTCWMTPKYCPSCGAKMD